MNKFEVGKSYTYGDSFITVAKRTAKTIITSGGSKVGIEVVNGVEQTKASPNRLHVASAARAVK
jgi:hypothetical protein